MAATLPLARSRMAPVARESSRMDTAGGSPSPIAHAGDLQLVTCFVGGEEYGLEISRVREIMRVGRITEIPSVPPHVRFVKGLGKREKGVVLVLDLDHALRRDFENETASTAVSGESEGKEQ